MKKLVLAVAAAGLLGAASFAQACSLTAWSSIVGSPTVGGPEAAEPDVPRFSLVGFTEKSNNAHVLRWSWKDLARIDPRNDGQLLFFDQVIPGATLLGYANADHFAVAVPFEEQPGSVGAGLALGHAPFPRGVLLEAIVLYVVESVNGTAALE